MLLLEMLITFRVSRRRREMYCGHARLTWGSGIGDAPSCALLGRFAIGARVALLWQQRERETLASTCLYSLYA